MTPQEILDDVLKRFMVLYHNDPEDLKRLLKQALAKYQDKAGYICETWYSSTVIIPPERMSGIASVYDKGKRYVPWHVDMPEGVIVLDTLDKNEAPYCLAWFVNLRELPLDEDLPGDCPTLLADYLEALIAVQNTERQRNAMLITGQQTQDLPTVADLRQRIKDLELEMEDNKSIIVPASYF